MKLAKQYSHTSIHHKTLHFIRLSLTTFSPLLFLSLPSNETSLWLEAKNNDVPTLVNLPCLSKTDNHLITTDSCLESDHNSKYASLHQIWRQPQ